MNQEVLKQARILCVDDQPSNLMTLEEMLCLGGYTTYKSLTDPRQVLAAMTEFEPDIILLDLMMPVLDGYAVLEQLRTHIPADTYLPVLVLTADITDQAKRRALTLGARDFLTKPLDLIEVLLRVNNLLETRFLYREQQCRAEARIAEQAALLNWATDAILVTDRQSTIHYWNRGAERLYGWSAAEALGRNALDLLKPSPPSEVVAALQAVVEQQGYWSEEFRKLTRWGTEVIVASRWVHIGAWNGQSDCKLDINTDITEKKHLEAQLLRTQRMESIGALAGGIAHDLNNVLTPIMMSVQMFGLQFTDPVSQSLLSILDGSVQRGADMVKQILTFARGSEGQRLPLQLTSVIKELTKMARETFPKNIDIQPSVPTDLWLVSGDSTQLYQVLMNLCVNARDAMPAGGKLTVSAANLRLDAHYAQQQAQARPGPYVLLTVRDTGSGMPSEVIDRIFDPFFTTKEQGKGTGLGLSVTHGIVTDHGGFVQVDSKVGRGTEFRVYLPALESAPMQQAEEQRVLPTGKGELILLVDDEASVTTIMKAVLEACGYRTLTASDGTEALLVYVQHPNEIQMVLTDIVMPNMDGTATIRALQKLNPRVKIIATSGVSASGHAVEAAGLCVKTFLDKPFTAETLLTTVHNVLQNA